jgi:hypothetical protein
MHTFVEHRGQLLRRSIAGQIGTADVSHKKRVPGKDRSYPRRISEIYHRDADALDCVAGSPKEIEPAIAELDGVAVLDRRMRERRSRRFFCSNCDRRTNRNENFGNPVSRICSAGLLEQDSLPFWLLSDGPAHLSVLLRCISHRVITLRVAL